MKVIKWISGKEAEGKETSCGGLGGFFANGMRWNDYADLIESEQIPYINAIRDSVIALDLKVGGDMHQLDYIPLFSDGTVGNFSFRGWGDLMAAIWSEHEDKNYCYMDFYMGGW